MRILRIRRGFQADHSSSSYLFYAVDRPVSKDGQRIAHRYSSRAEVDEHTARYVKWGDSELRSEAFKVLLSGYYDVMASESYDWWTLMIAVPKTPELVRALAPFHDARGHNDQGVDVEDFGARLGVVIYGSFQANGADFGGYDDDPHDHLVDLLAEVRAEIMAGNVSFLQAVASFYGASDGDEDESEDEEEDGPDEPPARWDELSKAELQKECAARGIEVRKSWSKAQLRDALVAAKSARPAPKRAVSGRPAKLSKAAREIVDNLERV